MNSDNQAQVNFWNGDITQNWIDRDHAHERAFGPVTHALLHSADLRPHERVLDVGAGTGQTTVATYEQTGCKVTALDVSEPFLGVAKNRADDAGADVDLILGDAQTHAFEPAIFDKMISRFGMMFFSDPTGALRNIAGGMRKGGQMHFICWGAPEANPWFGLPRQAVARHFGSAPQAVPGAPGPFGFSQEEKVIATMSAAGLSECSAEILDIELLPADTIADMVQLVTMGPISSAMRERNAGPADLKGMQEILGGLLQDFVTPKGVVIPARLNLYSGVV